MLISSKGEGFIYYWPNVFSPLYATYKKPSSSLCSAYTLPIEALIIRIENNIKIDVLIIRTVYTNRHADTSNDY